MFQWPAYLALARELAPRTDEASMRSAISRAYYAAYGVACDYVGSRRVYERQGRSLGPHEQRWEVFSKDPGTAPQNLRSQIIKAAAELKRKRITADYEKHASIKRADVEWALEKADELISAIKQLPAL